MKFHTYFIVRGTYIRGVIFERNFVFMSRRLIFGGLIFEILRYLLSKMGQNRVSRLAILNIERVYTNLESMDLIIDTFGRRKIVIFTFLNGA